MGVGAMIVAVNVIPSPNRTEALTFSTTTPDCALACRALNEIDAATKVKAKKTFKKFIYYLGFARSPTGMLTCTARKCRN